MAALHRAGYANLSTSRQADDGLRLRDAFMTAAVRCAPPDNKPTPAERAACLTHLERELDALPTVKVVVALGRMAFDAYLSVLKRRGQLPSPRPEFGHGQIHVLSTGVLISCYHPSRQNTHTGKLTPPMLDAVFALASRRLRETTRPSVQFG
jgi:uracil-DNA glycosylase family 4